MPRRQQNPADQREPRRISNATTYENGSTWQGDSMEPVIAFTPIPTAGQRAGRVANARTTPQNDSKESTHRLGGESKHGVSRTDRVPADQRSNRSQIRRTTSTYGARWSMYRSLNDNVVGASYVMQDMTKPMTRGAMADGEREENSETAGGRENP